MEVYATMIPPDTYDSSFYRSVIALHADEFQKAQQVGFNIIIVSWFDISVIMWFNISMYSCVSQY